jgi:hypothetical protein
MRGFIAFASAFPIRFCSMIEIGVSRHRLRLASAGLAVATATVAAAGAGGLLGLIGGLLAVVGAAGVAVTESCTDKLASMKTISLSSPIRN